MRDVVRGTSLFMNRSFTQLTSQIGLGSLVNGRFDSFSVLFRLSEVSRGGDRVCCGKGVLTQKCLANCSVNE